MKGHLESKPISFQICMKTLKEGSRGKTRFIQPALKRTAHFNLTSMRPNTTSIGWRIGIQTRFMTDSLRTTYHVKDQTVERRVKHLEPICSTNKVGSHTSTQK